jgi:hypothetical protein
VVAYGIDLRYVWPATGKRKTIDLAIGKPDNQTPIQLGDMSEPQITRVKKLSEVYLSCEAKSVMTEHGKSQPRVFDELSSSHEIVHQGRQEAIAGGIAVVNIATRFVSPLRQKAPGELRFSEHRQPYVTEKMVTHLQGLPVRNEVGEVGFDAYCTVIVDCDNQGRATIWEDPPAPQPGDINHYETFLRNISKAYEERFASLP